MKTNPVKFDYEIQVRSWLLGVAVTTIAAKFYGADANTESLAALGVFLGATYDFVAFNVKKWWAGRKDAQ